MNEIEFVESVGELVDEYIADESQLTSNAGSAEIYRLPGGTKYFEITTWNEYAEEHTSGTKTMVDVTEAYREFEEENYKGE